MGLSVASLNPISAVNYTTSKQQVYNLDNQSSISSAYRESLGNTVTPEGVNGPAPVQYAASRMNLSRTDSLSANQRMTRGLNNIAAGFNGVNTYYDRNSQGNAYNTIGRGFDAYA